mmetsp:Transcript_11306/g.26130  ORF Transcript_11306/g.26130 Transcript_11306/m.26130 type:complete len:201 (-) Transcript_11306:7-609(-)
MRSQAAQRRSPHTHPNRRRQPCHRAKRTQGQAHTAASRRGVFASAPAQRVASGGGRGSPASGKRRPTRTMSCCSASAWLHTRRQVGANCDTDCRTGRSQPNMAYKPALSWAPPLLPDGDTRNPCDCMRRRSRTWAWPAYAVQRPFRIFGRLVGSKPSLHPCASSWCTLASSLRTCNEISTRERHLCVDVWVACGQDEIRP